MAFIESPRFPDDIAHGATIRPQYDTDIVVTFSGHEKRYANWEDARLYFDVSLNKVPEAKLQSLNAFFRLTRGSAHSFRFKDWLDYKTTITTGIAKGNSGTASDYTFDLYKRYESSAGIYDREIKKPIDNISFKFYDGNGTLVNSADYSIDTTVGQVTKTTRESLPTIYRYDAQVDMRLYFSLAHDLSIGDTVHLVGFQDVPDGDYIVKTAPSATTATFEYDASGLLGYNGAAQDVASTFYRSGASYNWEGEFDVPARFEKDTLSIDLNEGYGSADGVSIIETRVV